MVDRLAGMVMTTRKRTNILNESTPYPKFPRVFTSDSEKTVTGIPYHALAWMSMNNTMTKSRTEDADDLAAMLMENLSAFQGFARRRTGDDDLAADAVQESLMRAMKAEPTLAHREDLVAWFYRILRNVLTDLHRRKTARGRAMERFADESAVSSQPSREIEAVACQCFRSLLPTLKPEYARVIEICDLDEETPEQAALLLGISKNNLKVRLHRARGQLRTRLEQTCQLCATHGCLDCNCAPRS